ncbi:MAG: endonuclease/exonuclease/phosphatase [Cytophagaceae bacterium]|nr:endonuclease/exonuclease/phosphatase [Cytophagaceae bacterium]|tara:strand:- start:3104 stop:3934 length:831 start_codon:yes stop_codon:yes gene_type:complete
MMNNKRIIILLGIVFCTIPFFGFWLKPNKKMYELKVLSYNIHHANPPSQQDSIDLNAIIKVIESTDADLLALQEIDDNTLRSGHGNQATIIAEALGMQVFFGKTIDFQGGGYGIAILSRFPLANSQIYRLPTQEGTGGEPRVLITTRVSLQDGQEVTFACTHLDAQRTDTNRQLQIDKITELTRSLNGPLIIGGDFNAEAGTEVIDSLDTFFTRTCLVNCPPTIPADAPAKTIDFIAFKNTGHLMLKQHQVIQEPYASDHLPVLATFSYPVSSAHK